MLVTIVLQSKHSLFFIAYSMILYTFIRQDEDVIRKITKILGKYQIVQCEYTSKLIYEKVIF